MTQTPAYQQTDWPVLRNALVSYLNSHRPHSTQGFVEIDVTQARIAIRCIRKKVGIAVSFHAFVLHCMVRAATEHPAVLRYRHRNKLIAFDDIDVLTPIEKRLTNGVRIPVGYIVRSAQQKTLAQMNLELRAAVRADDLATNEAVRVRRAFAKSPAVIRNLVSRRVQRDPFLLKRLHGTALLTNFQNHGFANPMAAFGPTVHTLSLAIGPITDRLRLDARGEVVNRKVLMISGIFDHDIIDGMIVARFADRFSRLIESADGLDEAFVAQTRRLLAQGENDARTEAARA